MPFNRLDVLVFGICAVAAVVGVLLVFQVFFRFQYVHAGTVVTRVDRVSGRMCVMPCLPAPAPSPPTPAPTALSLDHQEQRAIAHVQSDPRTRRLLSGVVGEGYAWNALPADTAIQRGSERGSADESDAFLVCYCDQEGFGLRWEVHLNSAEAYLANDNKILSARYGARLRERAVSTPSPARPSPVPVQPRIAGGAEEGIVRLLYQTHEMQVLGPSGCEGAVAMMIRFKDDGTSGCAVYGNGVRGVLESGADVILVPVTSAGRGTIFDLLYEDLGSRVRFVGILPGDGSGNLSVSLESGLIIERNGQREKRSTLRGGHVVSPVPGM